MSSAGMRAVGLAGSMLPRRGGGGIAHAEVAPGGADLSTRVPGSGKLWGVRLAGG